MPKIDQTTVENAPLPLPPFAEQQCIVAEVERRLSLVEELEAVVNTNLQRATRLHQSILQRAFEGKLVQHEQVYRAKVTHDLPLTAELPSRYCSDK